MKACLLAVALVAAARSFAVADEERRPHYLRAALEEAAALAAGSLWYWIDDRNIVDWDYPSLKQRLTGEAWRFDNNTFPINYAWHAVNGAGFHAIARANGLGMWPSFGYGFATSMVWEYALEFREKVSINDVIVTPGSGLVLGEFLWRLGAFLGYPGLGHELVDGPAPPGPPMAHRLEISYGAGLELHEVRFTGELAGVSSLDLRVPFDLDGAGVDLLGDALLWSWRRGALTAGTSLAYRYRYEDVAGWKDRLSLMHLPGAALDVRTPHVLASARAHLDFAGIHAASYSEWAAAYPGVTEKTVLRRHGYYYAWGWSARLRAEVLQGPFLLGAAALHGRYQSIEGLDRNQEEITLDVPASDRVTDLEAWLRFSHASWFVQLRGLYRARSGDVGGVPSERSTSRLFLEVGVGFH